MLYISEIVYLHNYAFFTLQNAIKYFKSHLPTDYDKVDVGLYKVLLNIVETQDILNNSKN